MTTTPQERLALGVGALLLSFGVGARFVQEPAAPAELHGGTAAGDSLGSQRERANAEGARERRRKTPLVAGERIDPNRASADELDRLPRVGPSLAERIVEHREANGPFQTLADLDAVPGVGPAMLESIGPHVALRPAPAGRPVSGPSATPSEPMGGPLDVNSATPAALEALPGIGPALAERIVAWRNEHGRFGRVEDLASVPGIGPKTLERLRPMIRVSP